jgi:3-phenylpropionate/cinnamic acid dioxygenase small subunit
MSAEVSAPPDAIEGLLGVGMELHFEIERFLVHEAKLLDDHRYDDWVELFADDVRYWMPTRTNRLGRDQAKERSGPGDVANFDEGKADLKRRVFRLNTGKAWAEDPPSRTRHLVTNVQAAAADADGEYDVTSAFLVYRNRADTQVDVWVGERQDVLRRLAPAAWQIARRTIVLDQSTVLSSNLSVFF